MIGMSFRPRKNVEKLQKIKPRTPEETLANQEQYRRDLQQLQRLRRQNYYYQGLIDKALNKIRLIQDEIREEAKKLFTQTTDRELAMIATIAKSLANRLNSKQIIFNRSSRRMNQSSMSHRRAQTPRLQRMANPRYDPSRTRSHSNQPYIDYYQTSRTISLSIQRLDEYRNDHLLQWTRLSQLANQTHHPLLYMIVDQDFRPYYARDTSISLGYRIDFDQPNTIQVVYRNLNQSQSMLSVIAFNDPYPPDFTIVPDQPIRAQINIPNQRFFPSKSPSSSACSIKDCQKCKHKKKSPERIPHEQPYDSKKKQNWNIQRDFSHLPGTYIIKPNLNPIGNDIIGYQTDIDSSSAQTLSLKSNPQQKKPNVSNDGSSSEEEKEDMIKIKAEQAKK